MRRRVALSAGCLASLVQGIPERLHLKAINSPLQIRKGVIIRPSREVQDTTEEKEGIENYNREGIYIVQKKKNSSVPTFLPKKVLSYIEINRHLDHQ